MENKFLTSLTLFIPLGLVSKQMQWSDGAIFFFNFMGIIPLAWLIGSSTEDLAATSGDAVGGLLNATFGNVVEMLLCVAGVRSGQLVVTQCTLIGSILSNLLLVMGCAFFFGGCYFKQQHYSQAGASVQCSMLTLSVLALGLPTMYGSTMAYAAKDTADMTVLMVSRYTSALLLLAYVLYLFFQLRTHAFLFQGDDGGEEEPTMLSPTTAAIILGFATVTTSFCTELLIEALQGTVDSWQVSQEFIGIILLPIIGNAAEHYTAITVALQNKMDLSLGVACGSSCQMALLVTPFTVVAGWWLGQPMSLDFHPFQLFVMLMSVLMVSSVLANGRTNWLEGAMLLFAYIIISMIYWFEDQGVSTYNERGRRLLPSPGDL
jgi:Ca2+:H+ antiporter